MTTMYWTPAGTIMMVRGREGWETTPEELADAYRARDQWTATGHPGDGWWPLTADEVADVRAAGMPELPADAADLDSWEVSE